MDRREAGRMDTKCEVLRPSVLIRIFMLLVVLFLSHASSAKILVDLKKTKVWGPGLNGDATLPARYFFIQPYTKEGEKITESIGERPFVISIRESSGQNIRYRQSVLGRRDGLYIVVYRLYSSPQDVVLEITYNDEQVAESPYLLNGPLYHEKCTCPQPDLTQWYADLGCPESYSQIDEDLSIFPTIDPERNAAEIISKFSNRGMHSLCHYKIIDNKIYRKTHGQHVGFKMFSDSILLSLARKVHLPDTEFVVNLGDWPLEKTPVKDKPAALFSWCGSEETRDIVMPTYDLTESSLEMLGRQSVDVFSVMGHSPVAWENKTEQGFWRGRDSRQERLDLVVMARQYPDLIDARLTKMFFFPHDEEKLGELVSHISFFDFFKYKYQINLDGTVAAYRLPYLLSGDGVVLKQESPYYEHFYRDLEPFKHYIPIRRDLQDLRTRLQWAKDNDDKVREISKNAQAFTIQNIDPANVFCYHVKLIEKFTSLFTAPVTAPVGDEWELVEQPDGQETKCSCKRSNQNKQQSQQQQQQQQKKKEEL